KLRKPNISTTVIVFWLYDKVSGDEDRVERVTRNDDVEISEAEKNDLNELVALFLGEGEEHIHKLYERKLHGDFDTNNELGTSCPTDVFDPHGWSEDSYLLRSSIAKAQKVEKDKLEEAKKERTRTEFTTGTICMSGSLALIYRLFCWRSS
uniref:Uncharacterized protein n=1 Tax=Scophthalmus maximus TaxID=52904 RepID=A0A8D2ZIY6_SCOMX